MNNCFVQNTAAPLDSLFTKLNSVDLTDKGIDLITGNSEDPTLFVLPDIAEMCIRDR